MKKIVKTTATIVLVGLFSFANAQVKLDSGLQSYYPFDNDVKDYATTNNVSAIYNSATFTVGHGSGGGQALSYNGNTYTEIASNFAITNGTISFWVKPRSAVNPNTIQRLYSISDPMKAKQQFTVNFNINNNGKIDVRSEGSPTGSFVQFAKNQSSIDAWHHVVVTCKLGNGAPATFYTSIYVDGVWNGDSSFSHNPVNGPVCFLGKFDATSAQSFIGDLDELIIYNRVLNTGEITALKNGSLPNKASTNIAKPISFIEQCYPNPTSGDINLNFTKTIEKGTVILYNATGQNVYEANVLNQSSFKGTFNLPVGIYMLHINSDGILETKKLVIE